MSVRNNHTEKKNMLTLEQENELVLAAIDEDHRTLGSITERLLPLMNKKRVDATLQRLSRADQAYYDWGVGWQTNIHVVGIQRVNINRFTGGIVEDEPEPEPTNKLVPVNFTPKQRTLNTERHRILESQLGYIELWIQDGHILYEAVLYGRGTQRIGYSADEAAVVAEALTHFASLARGH